LLVTTGVDWTGTLADSVAKPLLVGVARVGVSELVAFPELGGTTAALLEAAGEIVDAGDSEAGTLEGAIGDGVTVGPDDTPDPDTPEGKIPEGVPLGRERVNPEDVAGGVMVGVSLGSRGVTLRLPEADGVGTTPEPVGRTPDEGSTPEEGSTPDGSSPEEVSTSEVGTPEDGSTPDGSSPEEVSTSEVGTPEDGSTPDGSSPDEGRTPEDGRTTDGSNPEDGSTPVGSTPVEGSTPEGMRPEDTSEIMLATILLAAGRGAGTVALGKSDTKLDRILGSTDAGI
jgi:hypothetical protein